MQVLKDIGAAVAGYAAIFITIFVTFTLAYRLMGPDRAFEPDTYDVSLVWVVLTLVVGWSAATLGGKVSQLIARNLTAPKVLIGIVGLLGILQLVMTLMAGQPEAGSRLPGEPSSMQAMSDAVQPLWITIVNPIIGMLGVAYGGGLFRRS